MLQNLRNIVQEVNAASDLQAALAIIVSRVRATLKTDVCSVYLLDADIDSHVLMASQGLRQESVRHVKMAVGTGLIGLVAKHAEPVNLPDAAQHPDYLYFQESGEEAFHSFLGVPIIHHRAVLGVLVVQNRDRRRFDEAEEAFLVTLSAQLAGVIAHAEALDTVQGLSPSGKKAADNVFTGIAGSPGVAMGTAVVMFPAADLARVPARPAQDIKAEIAFFKDCIDNVRKDLGKLIEQIGTQLASEERQLLGVYLAMLDDDALGNEVVERISAGHWAQGALAWVARQHIRNFEAMEDAYMRERATDIRDLCARVLAYLQEKEPIVANYRDDSILVAEELTPAMLMEAPRDKLKGLIATTGSSSSHVAILARGMDIPTIMGAVDLPIHQLDGRALIIDAYKGEVISNPSAPLRERYEETIREQEQLDAGLRDLRDLPCETADKHRVHLWVNTGLLSDVLQSIDQGAEGIGLFRTEVPFLMAERFPSEQEQAAVYREQLEAFAPKQVTMRTLDVGGDKALPYFPIDEANPFLGWRGIRVTLDHPEIFIVQIRAMLRASVGLENLSIMLPMVTNKNEVTAAMQFIKRACRELRAEGLEVRFPSVGLMIELPAAVYQTRAFAAMVDFISVGSNDLTQYLLAVDRNNPRVANLYTAYHPAVLGALQHVVTEAHALGKPVSICGEMAADPGAAVLLMAMGFDVLSMNAGSLSRVKAVLRSITMASARALLTEVQAMDDAEAIRDAVDLALRDAGVDKLLRSSRLS